MPKEDSIYTHTALCAAFAGKFGAEPDCGEGVRRDGFGNDRERLLRALTWFERAENANSDDGKVLSAYIALNALFNRLGDEKIPESDERGKMRPNKNQQRRLFTFVGKVAAEDRDGVFLTFICDNAEMIKNVIGHPYLERVFWESAREQGKDWEANRRRRLQEVEEHIHNIRNWLEQNKGRQAWKSICGEAKSVLYSATESVRVLRNQMVHGACCYGDNYNRSQMRYCAEFLPPMVARMIKIMLNADNTGNDKWGKVAAPPQTFPDDAPPKTAKALRTGKD